MTYKRAKTEECTGWWSFTTCRK